MNIRLLSSLVALATTGACLPLFSAVDSGSKAPGFTLKDSQGKAHSLSDFEGKFVVLEWFNHQCPFVRKHYDSGNMQALQKKYTGQDVVWLTLISSAQGEQGYLTPDDANGRIKEESFAGTAILLDASGKVGRKYGAAATPHMFVIDPEGTLIYQGAIDSVRSADPDDIAGATNYVAAALEAAMAGKPVAVDSTRPYGCGIKYAAAPDA